MQAHVGHRTARIGFWHPVAIFWSSWQRLVVGTDWLQSLHRGRNTTPRCHEGCIIFLCETCGCDLGDWPVWTEHAIWMLYFGSRVNGNSGKLFKSLIRKIYSMGKKFFSLSDLLLLRWEIFLHSYVLKRQCVMLIKWENFGAFLSWLLRWEGVLTDDVLKQVLLYMHLW
jgi:hypothetical protein